MNAEVLLHPTAGAIADETVRRSIKALCAGRGVKTEDLARAVGMTPSTLYRRLAGNGSSQAFSAGEAAAIATYFGVGIQELYTGLGGAVIAPAAEVTPPRGVTVSTRWSPLRLDWRWPTYLQPVA